mmetsp:Transcript_26719/g.61596  ORF Transcript_26719/g.61596 Transcript_26719/m.61596 type:complete len:349 (-) Transcript_26719:155-1201(-)
MGECVRAAGLEAVRQTLVLDWGAALDFLKTLPADAPCVLKPRRGVASVGVYKASSRREAKAAFSTLLGMPVSVDQSVDVREGILLQEFIQGTEFAVDTVSCAGEHKVIHLWRYDKRELNGAHFVYQATILCDGRSAEEEAVAAYACRVLDCLGVRDGPAHIEVRLAEPPRGPCLIEANIGRWHGIPYSAMLGNLAQGYNAFGAVMDALLCAEAWQALPSRPDVQAHARMVHLVLKDTGRVRGVHLPEPGDEAFPSLVEAVSMYTVGSYVSRPTVDLKSDGGYLLLVSRSREALEDDYARVLQAQHSFFELEPDANAGAEARFNDVPSCVQALLALDDGHEEEDAAARS